MASQMNLRELAQAKSRTFLAAKVQVLVPVARLLSFFTASSWLTMITGFFAVLACSKRFICVLVRTWAAFWSVPVAPTTWSAGAVMLTR